MRMVVAPDLMAHAGELVGVPYRPKGDDPETGWDCRGAVRFCLQRFCGLELPDYRDLYEASTGRAERARRIAEGLTAWRTVEAQPGVAVFLSWLGRSGHLGFMLDRRRFLHADLRCGTEIADLEDPACPYRPRSFHVPAFVTEIVQP